MSIIVISAIQNQETGYEFFRPERRHHRHWCHYQTAFTGSGRSGNDPGLDQGVGVYVDDVYLNRTTGALLEVYDVERIEVLKGPQGNLYGRNTIGGAIKYVGREPNEVLHADVEVKIGEFNQRHDKLPPERRDTALHRRINGLQEYPAG